MGICYIVGAGDFSGSVMPKEGDLLVAADGGYRHLASLGLTPDLLLGDLDSFSGELPTCPILRFPPEKDDTDTALAIRTGEERGYREFRIYGCLGGARISHTVSVLATLVSATRRGLSVTLFGEKTRILAVADGEVCFPRAEKDAYLSVFAFDGAAEGVDLEGLKYPLKDATLYPHTPLGVSNEFQRGISARVSCRRGCLILICEEK